MSTPKAPSKKKPAVKPVEQKKKTSYYKIAVVLSKENGELKDELQHSNIQLSQTQAMYEAVKERLSELNKPQPGQEEKKQCAEPSRELTRSERILARFGEELNHFNHVSDLIDGKIEAIGGNSTQKEVIDNAKPSAFLDELEVCIARFEVANKRNLLMFDHLCKII